MKFFFPLHLDGDNRGCEGIAKGSAIILGKEKSQILGFCSNITLDERLGISNFVSLIKIRVKTTQRILFRIRRKFCRNNQAKLDLTYLFKYLPFIKKISVDDVFFSTGGDMFCYGDNEAVVTAEIAQQQKIKTILWGCSMGPQNLTPRKKDVLEKFALIYARESLTYNFFKSLGLKKVVCFPDPAFVLEAEPCSLPDNFVEGITIGLNISNLTVGSFDLDTPFGIEIKKLVDYILKETNFNILLIPHVFWSQQDDRILMRNVEIQYTKYGNRICMWDSSPYNYQQIRYVISKCRFFIGGRTHSVISAYSMKIPTIALGYSIKANGIALDLGLDPCLVVDSKNIKTDALLDAFKYLVKKEDFIKQTLEDIIPEYRKRPLILRQILNNLL